LVQDNEVDAVEYGEKAIAKNSCAVQALNNVAWVYATTENEDLSDLEKAEDLVRTAVRCSRGMHPDFLDTLAEVYRREGKFDLAAEQIRKAIELEEGTSRYLHDRLEEVIQSASTESDADK
jgi:tetratricopeptide (TPR) repeat protein